MAEAQGSIRLTGTTKRLLGWRRRYIATLAEPILAVSGKSRDDAIREILKALTVHIEANKRLGQMDWVAKRVGYSGQNPDERFNHLLSALREYIKTQRQLQCVHPVTRITWEPGSSRTEQQFTLDLAV